MSVVLVLVLALSSWLSIVKIVPKMFVSKMKMKQEKKKTYLWPKRRRRRLLSLFSFGPPRYSTHNPPHEQLLVRLGVGGVSFAAPCLLLSPSSGPFPRMPPRGRSLSRRSYPHCSPFPPHEQLLAAAVGGAIKVVGWWWW